MKQNLQVEIKFKRHMSKLDAEWFLLKRFTDLFLACSNTLLVETIPTRFC